MIRRILLQALPLACLAIAKPAQNKTYNGREYCTSDRCWRVAMTLHGAMTPDLDNVDPCENWDEFVCGNYDKQKLFELSLEPNQKEINVKTLMKKYVENILSKVVGNPYGDHVEEKRPESADKATYERMRRYYSSCMDEVALQRAKLSPLKNIIDQLRDIFSYGEPEHDRRKDDIVQPPVELIYQEQTMNQYDRQSTRNATRLLSEYQLWGLAKLAPQQSLFNSSEMAVGIQPWIAPGMPEKWMEKKDYWIFSYYSITEKILKKMYKTQWRDEHYPQLGKLVANFELELLNITPPAEEWRNVKANTVLWTAKDLEEAAPELMLHEVIQDLAAKDSARGKFDKIEVMFPEYWKRLNTLLTKTSRIVFRGFLVLKTFQQTYELMEDPLSDRYRKYMRRFDGTQQDLTQETKCKQRVSKHFGPIIGSVFINHTFTKEAEQLAKNMFEEIKDEYVKSLEDTTWMYKETKEEAIKKAKGVKAMIGFPKEAPNLMDWDELRAMFAGAAVHSWNVSAEWTHANDYLQMQRWYARRAWRNDLANPPNKHRWLLNAFDTDSYYSHQLNSIVVPAGIMFEPMFSPELPSYVNYGGLGTLMGTEFAHAFDNTGMGFSANGTMGSWLTEGDQARYDDRMQCFFDKYDGLKVTGKRLNGKDKEIFHINGERVIDNAITDTHGVDAAYYAWKSRSRKDEILAGFSRFTDDQMFWLFRSVYHCSKERPQVQRQETKYGFQLPKRVRSWAPLKDSFAWHNAFKCKPREKICRLYGKDENGGKYTTLKSEELDPTSPANGSANVTETWNPNKFYVVEEDEEEERTGKKTMGNA